MKKLLLSILFIFVATTNYAQNQFAFGFEGTTAQMIAAGWQSTNQSVPAGASVWTIPATAPTTTFAGGAQGGTPISFALVNFNSTTGDNTISNWLISPSVNIQNGDIVTFYTKLGRNIAAGGEALFADNLELRLSTNGDFSANPSTGSSDLGDFTTLAVEINPALDLTTYPTTWTQFSYTVTGLSGPTDCKLGFRYFVTNGGPAGANSDIIGIDTFSVDRPLAKTEDFFASNFSIYPNPAKSTINLNSKNGVQINKVQILDINGRVVNEINPSNVSEIQINISELNAGVYFVKAQSENGVGTTKIVKQ